MPVAQMTLQAQIQIDLNFLPAFAKASADNVGGAGQLSNRYLAAHKSLSSFLRPS
jgi:hypothetical protein